jgi:hypothetical protein
VTEAVFLATVAFVYAALLAGVLRAEPRWLPYTALSGAAWLGFTAALAASGWLGEFDRRPPHFFALMAPTAVATVALALSPFGARLAGRTGWPLLIGFQVFRVAVEGVLASLADAGVAPPQMSFHGWNFDVLTGLSAPFVAWLAGQNKLGVRGLLIWNGLGLALLANVVTIAILSAPTPLRVFANEPANTFVTAWPWVWLPAFLVPAALLGHLLAFRKLRS